MPAPPIDAEAIQQHLVQRGVTARFARSLAPRLLALAAGVDEAGYDAMLSAVCVAFRQHRRGLLDLKKTARDMDEIQQLMEDFSSELRKLDEALETLSAYVLRLRTQSTSRPRRLH